jgi:predicted nuclease of predicted toxin-antitoxin system
VKFKLAENVPVDLASDLRGLGYDVDTVNDEGLGGAADPTVVDAAFASDRILFTLDKGIANLQRYPVHQHAGVVLFRPGTFGRGAGIAFVRERLQEVLEVNLAHRLTVVGRPVSAFDKSGSHRTTELH